MKMNTENTSDIFIYILYDMLKAKKEYSKKKQEIINACQKEPEREKVYFYVFVPWNGEPKVKHSFQSAKIEAFRISKKEWKEAVILKALKSYKPTGIIETNFVHEPKVFGKR